MTLSQAATIQAKSASLGDVRTAVQSARDGDTVTVPAATETWTTTLEITKNITLQGAGPGLTVIIDAVPECCLDGQGVASGLRKERFQVYIILRRQTAEAGHHDSAEDDRTL